MGTLRFFAPVFFMVFLTLTGCVDSYRQVNTAFLTRLQDSIKDLPGIISMEARGDTVILSIDTRQKGIPGLSWIGIHNSLVQCEIYKIEKSDSLKWPKYFVFHYLVKDPRNVGGVSIISNIYGKQDVHSSAVKFIYCNTLYEQSLKIIRMDPERVGKLNSICMLLKDRYYKDEALDMNDFTQVAFSAILAGCNSQDDSKYRDLLYALRTFFYIASQEGSDDEVKEYYRITDELYSASLNYKVLPNTK